MARTDASTLLRAGLLEGTTLLIARPGGDSGGSFAEAVDGACAGLGARVLHCRPIAAGESACVEDEEIERALAEAPGVDMVVIDAAGLYAAAAAAAQAREALSACLEASWNVTRVVASRAFLPRGRGGRIVYLAPAPAPGAGAHGDAARAGLENLGRTLSIEWARHGITAVTIAPGTATTAGEVAALTAYLASPAGAYFSGCLLDLRGPAGR